MEVLLGMLTLVRIVYQYIVPLSNSFSAYSSPTRTTAKYKTTDKKFRNLLKFWIFDTLLGVSLMIVNLFSDHWTIEVAAIVLLILAQRNDYMGVELIYSFFVTKSIILYETQLSQYVDSGFKQVKEYASNFAGKAIPGFLTNKLLLLVNSATVKTDADLQNFCNNNKELEEATDDTTASTH